MSKAKGTAVNVLDHKDMEMSKKSIFATFLDGLGSQGKFPMASIGDWDTTKMVNMSNMFNVRPGSLDRPQSDIWQDLQSYVSFNQWHVLRHLFQREEICGFGNREIEIRSYRDFNPSQLDYELKCNGLRLARFEKRIDSDYINIGHYKQRINPTAETLITILF